MPALPLDVFRVLVGLLTLAYCLRLIADIPHFWAPDGLMDQELSRELFPFSWQPLFQPGMGAGPLTAVLGGACFLALGVVLGVRPRLCAWLLYAVVVCGYRYNFLLLYVDDVVIHLLLLWVGLMPVGRTLTASSWRREGPQAWPRWLQVQVPGATVRLFLGNLVLLYTVAGLTKWFSALWLSGDAVYATLKLPAGWFAAFWGEQHLPLLRVLNHLTLGLEPLVAAAILLPAGSRLRRAAALALVPFHLGIALGLDVVFANLGCLTSVPLLLRHELMRWCAPSPAESSAPPLPRWSPSASVGALVLLLLNGAMVCSTLQPEWRHPRRDGGRGAPEVASGTAESGGRVQTFFFSALWLLGLAQQYRLLDWIDQRNYQLALEFHEEDPHGARRVLPGGTVFPHGMRSCLTFSYLTGVTWMPVPARALPTLRQSLHQRIARRYCQQSAAPVSVRLEATLQRTTPRNPTSPTHATLSEFRCAGDGAVASLSLSPLP
jgi:hypothetical protein